MKATKVIISMILTISLFCSGMTYQVQAEEITVEQELEESTELLESEESIEVQELEESTELLESEESIEVQELEESTEMQEPEEDAGAPESEKSIEVQNVQETVAERAAAGLNLAVDIPSNIKGGQEVTFKMNATGGSGTYRYRIAAVLDSELNSVYDVSYGQNSTYRDSNEFKFTFYASGTYYLRFGVMDIGTKPFQTITTGLYDYPVVIQDDKYPSVEQIVSTLGAQCETVCTTDFEKALWLHDWILDHADYDYSYTYCSPEGVLARGKGTCESYHRAYVKLLNRVGIETGRITGNGHVWTAVKMDGQWYQVDSTWDDGGASEKGTIYEHMYFGLTDDIVRLVHSDHKAPVPGYECTALENNYFIKTGQITQWSDPFVALIRQNLAAGQKQFTLTVSDPMPDNYKNVIYNLVAYQLSKMDWNNMKLSVSYANNQLLCSASSQSDNDNNTNDGLSSDSLSGKPKFIALLYENTLGRLPVQSEIDYWEQELLNGKTGADVAYGFLFSLEFRNKNYSNSDYVEHLYLSLMGRPSDAFGKPGWVKRLDDGMSRAYVFKQFINSQEFANLCDTYGIERGSVTLTEERDENYDVTRFVARNYTQFLGREYDADGLNYWSEPINNHTKSMQEIAFGFVFSPECINQNLSDSEFAAMMYRGCFDREGEQSGINYWTEKMQSGEMNRMDVFWGFANSQEFANMVHSYGL